MPILLRAFALLVILGATLYSGGGAPKRAWRLCLLCGEHATADLITNVLLFIPLGAALAFGQGRVRPVAWPRAVAGGALLSLAIEFTQLVIPGRDPSIGDVLSNTLGTGAGWLAARHAPRWLAPAPGPASGLALAAALLAGAAWWATGWLLQPSLPQTPYYGQWTARLAHLDFYGGRVREAWLGSRPLPPERLPWSAQARELLLRGARLRVRAVAGPAPPALAPLVSIYDEYEREILLVGIHRADLVLRYHTRSDRLGFDRPDLRFRGALAGADSGDRLVLSVERSSPGYCVAVNRLRRCGIAFTPGRGWALLLYPESFPGWLLALVDAAWLGGLLLPVGLWWRPGLTGGLAIGTVLAGVFGVPALTGLHPVAVHELAGVLAGAAAGVGLRVVVLRRRGGTPGPASRAGVV